MIDVDYFIHTRSILAPLPYNDAPSACRKLIFKEDADWFMHDKRDVSSTGSASFGSVLCKRNSK